MLIVGVIMFVVSLPLGYLFQKWITPNVCTPPDTITGMFTCVNAGFWIWFWTSLTALVIGVTLILWSLRVKKRK